MSNLKEDVLIPFAVGGILYTVFILGFILGYLVK